MNTRLPLAICLVLGGCASSSPPPTPRNLCMANAINSAYAAIRTHAVENRVLTKQLHCWHKVAAENVFARKNGPVNIGVVAIQVNVFDERNSALDVCMKGNHHLPEVPSAFDQFSRATFAISTVDLSACPSEFIQLHSGYVEMWRRQVDFARRVPTLTTGLWSDIVRSKSPGDQFEAQIIAFDKSIGVGMAKMREFYKSNQDR